MVVVVVVEVIEWHTVSRLLCKDSREWLLPGPFDRDKMCPLCWLKGPYVPLAGVCAADLETTGARDDVLGKEVGLGVDLGKVFADFDVLPEAFLEPIPVDDCCNFPLDDDVDV